MNVKRSIFASIGIALLIATASFAEQVKTDYDRSADFSQYKTYSWEKVQTQDPLWVDRIKDAANATKASAKPIEKYTLNNADPTTLATLNAKSKIIQVAMVPGAANPNENVVPLKPLAALAKEGKAFQPIANGLTAGQKGLLVAIPSMFGYNWLVHNLRVLTVELDNFAQELVSKMEIECLQDEDEVFRAKDE